MPLLFWLWRNPKVLAALVAGIAMIAAAWWLYDAGGDAERARAQTQTLESMRKAKEIDDDVRSLDDDALRDRMGRWMRDK